MKVTQRGEAFKPITIILESEEEAKLMYLGLNLPLNSLKKAFPCEKIDGEVVQQMYNEFSDVYHYDYDC